MGEFTLYREDSSDSALLDHFNTEGGIFWMDILTKAIPTVIACTFMFLIFSYVGRRINKE
ncbi:MAG: hypothetical protein WCI55_11830 [Armatimonadota bacterium]